MKRFIFLLILILLCSVNNVFAQSELFNDLPKVLCMGDSITQGSQDTPYTYGYRDYLQDSLGVGSYNFVGSYIDPSNKTDSVYDINHEGLSGRQTAGLISSITTNYLTQYIPKPNATGSVVLLDIGINDLTNYNGTTITEAIAIANIATIITRINNYDPTISIYVANLLPSGTGGSNTTRTSFNSALATQIATTKSSLGASNIYLVDMYAAFSDTANCATIGACMADSLHPKDAGYTVMASVWYKSILDCAGYANCS